MKNHRRSIQWDELLLVLAAVSCGKDSYTSVPSELFRIASGMSIPCYRLSRRSVVQLPISSNISQHAELR